SEVAEAACRLPGRPRVINLEPTSLAEVLECLRQVGRAAGRARRAEELVAGLQARIDAVARRSARIPGAARPRVAFLERLDPLFQGGHWTPQLIELAGGVDLLGDGTQRSRRIAWEAVRDAGPDVLFLCCCGFPVARTLQDLPVLRARPGFATLPAVRA